MTIKYCSRCWMISERPNISFNEQGVCSACEWANIKKKVNWTERQDYFAQLCRQFGKAIVPFSGGKDSVYVAYKMREFGIDPLLVTILPDLETEIGEWNRKNLCLGFNRINIKLLEKEYRERARECFIENGKVKHPWETAISAKVLRWAVETEIPFVVYGEEGGAEYGGYGGYERVLNRWKETIDVKYLQEYYFLNKEMFEMPPEYAELFFTQWSRFENWSPTKYSEFAIEKGMRTVPKRSIGTFTNDSQLSDKLQDLHCYILYIKFGFGRATADACIAIRDGQLDRTEALEHIENLDGDFPNVYLQEYLDYLRMTYSEFCGVLEKHANPELVEQSPYPKARHIFYLKSHVAKRRRQGTDLEFISPHRFDVNRTGRI